MNRQIKFRVWDLNNKKFENYFFLNQEGKLHELDQDCHGGFLKEVNNYIYQQFTGLLDKNGKEIYEGDVVKVTWTKGGETPEGFHDDYVRISMQQVCSIRFDDGRYECFPRTFHDFIYINKNTEIIGNIFETPELLKNTKEQLASN